MNKPIRLTARRQHARALFKSSTLIVGLAASMAATALPAHAQWWPWGQQNDAPRPREPINRAPPPPSVPAPLPGQGGVLPRPQGGAQGNVCLQLEQRLVAETRGAGGVRDQLPRIEQELRQAESQARAAQTVLDRNDCTEWFFFQKSLRKTPQCIRANDDLERARRRMAELDANRQQLQGSGTSSYRDDIIRELARNNCGPQYAAEARKLDRAGFWQTDEEPPQKGDSSQFGNLPFATYRTVCVRTCDGYFFPISFSTLPNHFPRDAELCKSRCAAPVELYFYQNPGADIKQAVSFTSQQPYTSLRSALRYQKEFVPGCSCKEAEYVAATEQAPNQPPAPQPRRAPQTAPKQ